MSDALAEYLFLQGTNFRTWEYLGAHRYADGFVFRVWAPGADAVYLTGDFNAWSDGLPLKKTSGGVWEGYLGASEFGAGSIYKYIVERNGVRRFKADPYAVYSQLRPENASIYCETDGYNWRDGEYMKRRSRLARWLTAGKDVPEPMNIYEVHLGSWRAPDNGEAPTYEWLAHALGEYAVSMNYTHIEIMPVTEYPFDGSWGYQCCGWYAPTSRYGNPSDFMSFVDILHGYGIGVIMDWVPAHFPKDEHGLFEFDGGPLYEYQGADRMEHRGWGTRFFDLGRNEVQCFLISNALYWAELYHIDGLRMDAVASMLYLDYDRAPGEWFPAPDGSNRNVQAVEFLKKLNSAISAAFPDVLLIAEESTDWHDITRPVADGGLGFHYKWNMGWMNDTLSYVACDSYFRKYEHEKLTFSLMYAFREHFILPVSHDEVVHGKKSLIDKMSGDYGEKFSTARAYLAYMIGHPGKKLLFMGCEFAQFREWSEAMSLEWFLLKYPAHDSFREYVRQLNSIYLSEPALWACDDGWDGFEWMEADNSADSLIIFSRHAPDGDTLVFVVNFTPVTRRDYWVRVPFAGMYNEILNSDSEEYGGGGCTNPGEHETQGADGRDYIVMNMMPLGTSVWKLSERSPSVVTEDSKK